MKRFALFISNLGLGIILFFLSFSVILVLTVANVNYIKNTLRSSGFYKNFVNSALDLAVSSNSQTNEISDRQILQEIKPVILKVATPEIVQKYSEQAIDAVSNWLNRKTPAITTTINLKPVKDNLIVQLSSYFESRYNDLPVCQNTSQISYDVASATCRPSATLSKEQFNQAAIDYASSLPFLQNDTVVLSQNTSSGPQIVRKAPTIYQVISWSPYILGFLGLITLVALYMLNSDKHKAWRTIGHAFLTTGALLLVTGALSIIVVERGIKVSPSTSQTLEQTTFVNIILIRIAKNIVRSFSVITLYFGSTYAIAGGICYFISHKIKVSLLKNTSGTQDKLQPTGL